MTGEIILEVRDLTVDLPAGMDRPHAVKDIAFDLRRGEILCIVGESGSGKSVTANTIMGLLPRSLRVRSGSIRLLDHDVLAMEEEDLRDLRGRVVSVIFQDPLSALNPLMKIGDQIVEQMEAHDVGLPATRRARAVELLAEVGLPDPQSVQHQYPFRLSGGQRQRVMIAMALSLDPDLLIADEPTTALDVTTQAQILDLIRTVQSRKGMGVMFITHDFGVVADIADRVIVMEKGNLVEQGLARTVLEQPRHPYTRQLIATVPRLATHARSAIDRAAVPVLVVEGLRKTFQVRPKRFGPSRQVSAVDDVSFALWKGRTLGVVGESGSGKSTLGKLVLRLLPADGGRIFYGDKNLVALKEGEMRPLRSRMQMVFQDPFASLNPRQTIETILTSGPRQAGMSSAEAGRRARALLDRVGLAEGALNRFSHEFSGGQRQRVGIARALMFRPDILIGDECVSALDVSVQAQILTLLQEIQQETGFSMLFITHDLRVASIMCDDLIVMRQGRVVEQGPAVKILRHPQAAYTQQLVAALPGVDWRGGTA